jgi:hypothetical protein
VDLPGGNYEISRPVPMLNGCFFFMVPLPSSEYANTCVGSEPLARRIKNNGRHGLSYPLTLQETQRLILTEVEYQ